MAAFADEDVARLRMVLGRMSRVLNREAESGGISGTQLSVLSSVARLGPITLGDLADIDGINPTMLSRVISKLVEQDFIQRELDELDRRVVRVQVTGRGRQFHEKLRTDRARLLSQALDRLEPAQADQLLAALDSLEALARHAQARTMRVSSEVLQ